MLRPEEHAREVRRLAASLGLVALGVVSAACGVTDTTCADCGGCGNAGMVQEPGRDIYLGAFGVDAAGDAAVELDLQEGVCADESVVPYRLVWKDGSVTSSPADGLPKLDTAQVEYGGGAYTWKDRDLTVSYERQGSAVVVTFSGAGVVVARSCSGANHVITCTPA